MSSFICFIRSASIALLVASTFVMGHRPAWGDWPNWRGSEQNSIAPEGDYPTKLSVDENLRWEIELPGPGGSTPIVWDNVIYLTCTIDEQDAACAFDAAGKELWRINLGEAAASKHRNATGSNPSPVTDGEHVYVYYKSGNLACLTLDGEKVWETNLQKSYGKNTLWWDLGTSPVLTSEGVVIAVIQEGDSYLVSFDKQTGDEQWKTTRQYDRPKESDQAYTTPTVTMLEGKEQVVTFGADHLTGHDALTGELLWDRDGFNPDDTPMWRVIGSQSVEDGIAVVPFGRAEFVAAVPLGASKVDEQPRWLINGVGSDVPTPLIHEGRVYLLHDEGRIACLDLETGEQLWKDKMPRGRGKFFTSLLLAGNTLYTGRENGDLYALKLQDDGLEVNSTTKVAEPLVASPTPLNNGILIRSSETLYYFGDQ